ncbi:hypothetical protein U9M48_008788 [Paspalum notatum var. saurae]|uniref:Uncharacterized protein n=1 Tax=Paspalum notatum var. saurae TaxID=547442 RepID=A0AAQ3SR53_PASNO
MAAQEELEEQAEEEAEEEAAQEDPMGESDVVGGSSSVRRFRFRSCNSVPKRPAERMLIRPHREWQWEDVTWDGVGRRSKMNSMLGALCRYYYPGMVEVDGERQVAEQWSHWRLKEYVRPDEGSSAGGSSARGIVVKGAAVKLKGELLRYRLKNEDDMEVLRSVRRHFCRAAEKVIDDAFYNIRISAVCQYYKRIKGENMSKEKGASQIYVTEQQYLQISVDWIVKDVKAWRWLAKKWSTPEWIASSKSHRENRGKAGPGHRFGADGHYSLARRMEHESEVPPSFMDVFVRGHRGPDPTNPEVLCTEAAREKMMAYGEEMTQRHGSDFHRRQTEVDAEALHASGGGRRHGRYAFGTGVVNYDQSISRARRSGSSSGSCRSSRTGRDTQAQEETRAAREEARQATRTVERLINMTAYMASYLQDITARLGPDVNLPPFCPPQMSPQQLRGGWHRRALSHRLSATSQLNGTAGLPATSGMDDTPELPATFEVDASYCTTLQPVDAITYSAIWITGFGLTPSWPNSRCGRA